MRWSVLGEARAPAPTDDTEVRELLDPFRAALAGHDGAVGGDGTGWDARVSVETTDGPQAAAEAAEHGIEIIVSAARGVGLPTWPVVRIEAVEANIFQGELDVTTFPMALGTEEVVDVAGRTRQRLHDLRSGHFPDPAYEVAATPLWLRSTPDSFLAGWDRRKERRSSESSGEDGSRHQRRRRP